MKKSITLIVATTVLSACTAFGPDRKPPKMPQPQHYAVESQPARTAAADGVAQQVTLGARPVPDWWKEFGSDDLNALVLKHLPSTRPLRIFSRGGIGNIAGLVRYRFIRTNPGSSAYTFSH